MGTILDVCDFRGPPRTTLQAPGGPWTPCWEPMLYTKVILPCVCNSLLSDQLGSLQFVREIWRCIWRAYLLEIFRQEIEMSLSFRSGLEEAKESIRWCMECSLISSSIFCHTYSSINRLPILKYLYLIHFSFNWANCLKTSVTKKTGSASFNDCE